VGAALAAAREQAAAAAGPVDVVGSAPAAAPGSADALRPEEHHRQEILQSQETPGSRERTIEASFFYNFADILLRASST